MVVILENIILTKEDTNRLDMLDHTEKVLKELHHKYSKPKIFYQWFISTPQDIENFSTQVFQHMY
jgi:hypothetical protein